MTWQSCLRLGIQCEGWRQKWASGETRCVCHTVCRATASGAVFPSWWVWLECSKLTAETHRQEWPQGHSKWTTTPLWRQIVHGQGDHHNFGSHLMQTEAWLLSQQKKSGNRFHIPTIYFENVLRRAAHAHYRYLLSCVQRWHVRLCITKKTGKLTCLVSIQHQSHLQGYAGRPNPATKLCNKAIPEDVQGCIQSKACLRHLPVLCANPSKGHEVHCRSWLLGRWLPHCTGNLGVGSPGTGL